MNRSNSAQLAATLIGLGVRAHLAGCLEIVDKIVAVLLFNEDLRLAVSVAYLTDDGGEHYELVRVSDGEGTAFIVIPVPRLDPSAIGHAFTRYSRDMVDLPYPEPDPEDNPAIVEARLREELLAMVDGEEIEAAVAVVLAPNVTDDADYLDDLTNNGFDADAWDAGTN
ncbi:MAG: hypothetical protein AAB413_04095 [Patescibacteria group bacterium]